MSFIIFICFTWLKSLEIVWVFLAAVDSADCKVAVLARALNPAGWAHETVIVIRQQIRVSQSF